MRAIYAGGVPRLDVVERPAGPTSGNGLALKVPVARGSACGVSGLGAREVEELRDALTIWLQANGR